MPPFEKSDMEIGQDTWWPPDDAVIGEFLSYSSIYDKTRLISMYNNVIERSNGLVSSASEASHLAQEILESSHNGEAKSYIRLGDADGNQLLYNCINFKNLTSYCLKKISRIYFGNDQLMMDNNYEFSQIILDSIVNADLVGGPSREYVLNSFSQYNRLTDVRGICGFRGVYHYISTHVPSKALPRWTDTWFSRSLLPYYNAFLSGQDVIGVISCYEELAYKLKKSFNILHTDSIVIPIQSSVSYKTGRKTSLRGDIGHYPDFYHSLLDKIRISRPGQIFIIAAGILSKGYCKRIKESGGIAIDVGSVADIWMGIKSRPDFKDDFLSKWRL